MIKYYNIAQKATNTVYFQIWSDFTSDGRGHQTEDRGRFANQAIKTSTNKQKSV